MLTEDDRPGVWPPPILSSVPPSRIGRYGWVLGWIGPVLSGLVGAVALVIGILIAFAAMMDNTSDQGGPGGWAVVIFLLIVAGASVGFVCGLAAWFIGKGVIGRRRLRQRTHHKPLT